LRVRLAVGPEGQVTLPPAEAEALGLRAGDDLELRSARGAFAVLSPARDGRGYFGGALSTVSVPEALNFVFSALKTGVLLLSFGEERERRAGAPERAEDLRRKSIYFREGQVVFASSSDRCHRLGAVLWRQGLLALEDLELASRHVRAGRPLGKVLVDEGILDSGQLYEGMTLQVKEIFLSAFLETRGEFTFVEGPFDERNAVKLRERTRELLLEGMRRADEVEQLAAALPDSDGVLRATGRAAADLGPLEARLLQAADGERTVRRAFDESQLDLYSGFRALAVLAERGLVAGPARPSPRPAEEEEVFKVTAAPEPPAAAIPPAGRVPGVGGPFDIYRRIYRHVFAALGKVQADAQERLNTYFERRPEKQRPLFEGVRVDAEGEVDVARVLQNVSAGGGYQGAAARARALEALEDLLSFMLFEVKNCLPGPEAEKLLREVGRMQVGKG
jgi:bifunctional DNA-binding transcriptional regulator/antitoxin component of YhaV-PrlF toxin-antitoxin module